MTVRTAMQTFGDNLASKLPPEALKALHMAIQSYDQFLSITQQVMGVQNPNGNEPPASAGPQAPQGPQNAMSQGARRAVPAGIPQRPGMQPA